MRADRLLAILLLLQARGRMTARELAAELEVSERTIYRDVDALNAAGVPVYGDPGPSGGYALLDRFRTRLTGLTTDEARALFALNVPAPLERLGVDAHLRSALRKLAAELPEGRRDDEARVRRRIHLDARWWRQGEEPVPYIDVIHQAVWDDRILRISYQTPFSDVITRTVAPYGLVAKAGVWFVVAAAAGRVRVYRVSSLVDVESVPERFHRPDDFDLAAFWRGWCGRHEAWLRSYRAHVRVSRSALPELGRRLGRRVASDARQANAPGSDAPVDLELSFESFAEARTQLLGFGRAVEVLAPRALRRSVQDFAEQIAELYAE